MMGLWRLAVAYLAAALTLACAKSSTGDSVLVVLEPGLKQEDYSDFFGGLTKSGYKLTFRAPKDTAPAVIENGQPMFEHIILFAPETKAYSSDITPQSLVELLSHNVNVLFTLGSKQTQVTSLASEFGLILPPPGTPLISHFPHRAEPAHVLPIEPRSHPALPHTNKLPIWFEGPAHALGTNPRLVPLLHAPSESFAADSENDKGADALVDAADRGGEGLWAGSALSVATGFQALSGARALWVGGTRIFSNDFARKDGAGNKAFAQDVASWVFQENLVLRIDRVTHHLASKAENETLPEMYTTNDEVTFTAYISKYDAQTGTWAPYSGIGDMQLEFTMLDPHIRTSLPSVPGQPGKYSVTFRAPDRHGVFKFVIDYKRKGWTHLSSSTVVPVVPPRHDGYPRFLSAAWPYYTGAISTSAAFVLFAALWLAGDDKDLRKKKGSTKTE